MDTTETENRHGSRDKPRADNVVRLPRDWLGPREDLVPFGPAAYRDTSEKVTELPRNADDFWGGADVQETAEVDTSPEAPRPARRRSLPGPRSLPDLRSLPRLQRRTALLLGLGVLGVLAVVGFMMGSGGGKPSAPGLRAATPTRSHASATGFDAHATRLRNSAAQHASRLRARHAASVRHRTEVRRHRAQARRHEHPRVAPTVQPVKYAGPSSVPSSDSGVSSSFSGSSTGETSAASSPPAPSATSASAAGSGSTAGPSSSSNQPATGANGSLGPGSSPDG